MARGINKVILVGNLGADPEMRTMPSGKAVANIRIATSESWTDKSTGEKKDRTEWHSISLFDKLGEIAAKFLTKGSQVYIEGRLRTRKWQDKEGNDRYSTEIIANEMQMLGGRPGANGQANGQASSQSSAPARSQDEHSAPGATSHNPSSLVGEDFDDDIPF